MASIIEKIKVRVERLGKSTNCCVVLNVERYF